MRGEPVLGRLRQRAEGLILRAMDLAFPQPLYEMSNYRPHKTGVPLVIWASQRGRARHEPWIKVSPSGSKSPGGDSVSVTVHPWEPRVIGDAKGSDPGHLEMAKRWVALNHEHLTGLWNAEHDFEDFESNMRRLPE